MLTKFPPPGAIPYLFKCIIINLPFNPINLWIISTHTLHNLIHIFQYQNEIYNLYK